MFQALLPSGLQQRTSQRLHIFELLLPLHPPGPGAVPQQKRKQTWRDFEQQFWLHFFPVNAEADAINALEGTSYYQGGWMVDDYLDNFQALVSDTGYTNPQVLVVKFRRGFRLGI